FPGASTTHFADLGHAVMANGEALEFEELYTPTGRWIRGVAFPSADNVCVFFRDVTRDRRAHGAEAQRAAIVQASAVGDFSLSPTGVIESWNHGAEKLLGYKGREVIGRRIDALIPEDRKKDFNFVRTRGSDHVHYQSKAVCKNGTTIDVSVMASPMYSG